MLCIESKHVLTDTVISGGGGMSLFGADLATAGPIPV